MTVDEILDEYDYKLHNLDRDEIKSALYDLILKEVVGEDEPVTTKKYGYPWRNDFRAEQRNKLKGLFDVRG